MAKRDRSRFARATPHRLSNSGPLPLCSTRHTFRCACWRRRSRLHQTATGQGEPHPTETDPSDWAEFVTLALAGAAANLGRIGAALAGRPGSWEARKVEDLLYATVGSNPNDLWRHRTNPVRIEVDDDDLLATHTEAWWQYDQAESQIDRLQNEAEQDQSSRRPTLRSCQSRPSPLGSSRTPHTVIQTAP